MKKHMGQLIRERIKELGMTQKEFCERTGMATSTVSNWRFKDIRPKSDKIPLICEVLDIEPAYLFSVVDDDADVPDDIPEFKVTIEVNKTEYDLLKRFQSFDREFQNRLLGYLNALSDINAEQEKQRKKKNSTET